MTEAQIRTALQDCAQRRYCEVYFLDGSRSVFRPTEVRFITDCWVAIGVEYYEAMFTDVLASFRLDEVARVQELLVQPSPVDLD